MWLLSLHVLDYGWIDGRKEKGYEMLNVSLGYSKRGINWRDRKVLEEVRARKDTLFVRHRVAQDNGNDDDNGDEEEEEDNELCFQYDVDVLPPYEIDLDEIDEFLAQDVFMAELNQ